MATHALSSSSTPAHERDDAAVSESSLNRWAFWYFALTLVLSCFASAWALLTI